MKRRKATQHFVVYLAGRAFLFILGLLPLRVGRTLGRILGLVFYRISPRHRRIALSNLDRAFGATHTGPQRRRIARACFSHMGMLCTDASYFPRLARIPTERIAVYEGVHHLLAAASRGHGVLVFSGHFGHWELIALLQPRLGLSLSMVVRHLENYRFNRMLMGLRNITGNTLLPKGDAVRGILRALRAGRAVAIMIDQNVRGKGGLFVDFFGTAASTSPSLATFAFKCDAPIVPVFSYPMPDGRLHISYRDPIYPVRRGRLADDVLALTRTCTAMLEDEIRRRPELWLWMHDRWRTRPASAGRVEAGRMGTAPNLPESVVASAKEEVRSL